MAKPIERIQKTILVTGGAGFIGSHLCERLVRDGHRVISLDNYFTGSRDNHVEGVEYREGHTKDVAELVPEDVDLIYHLGEYSRVEKSFEDVEYVYDLNKVGTFAVLEYTRQKGAKIVYAGSSTKFGDGGLGRDQSPYAWTKATNTELVRNYGDWFGIPYAITYFYNVYGPGERAGAFGTVIEIFRQNRLHGRPLTVVAPGTQTRNFTHVDDIVAGLVLVGDQGSGDDFGLGSEESYSILDVARLFGGKILMLPERAGNRKDSGVQTEKARALGWKPEQALESYIRSVTHTVEESSYPEDRILVFTTTFHPIVGPAEQALMVLMQKLPETQFDIVTTLHSAETRDIPSPLPNVHIHRVGFGTTWDKYLLPILGARKGGELMQSHRYLFMWSLMASYGAIAALRARKQKAVPLLVTLADQRLRWYERLFLRFLLGKADQVYASTMNQKRSLGSLEKRMRQQRSLGAGDSFANQIRFSYSQLLKKHT